MKLYGKTVAALAVICLPMLAQAGKYTVSGVVEGSRERDKVVLAIYSSYNYSPEKGDRCDTLELDGEGRFSFSGKLKSGRPAHLMYISSSPDAPVFPPKVYFALTPSKMLIRANAASFSDASISGGLYDDPRNTAFVKAEKEAEACIDSLRMRSRKASAAGDTVAMKALKEQSEEQRSQYERMLYSFFKEDTPFAPFQYISTARIYRDDADGIAGVCASFGRRAAKSGFADIVKQRRDYAMAMKSGRPCPELLLTDRDGRIVSLSDYKGKYLLVSHWSAGCGGSHYADPLISKVYEKYRQYGLEVLGTTDPSAVHFKPKGGSGPVDMKKMVFGIFKHEYKDIDLSEGDNYMFEKRFNVNGTPYFVFVSPEGIIIEAGLGVEVLDTVNKTMESVRVAAEGK